MAYQLVYTSVKIGLDPSQSGFTTVAMHQGIRKALVAQIESFSGRFERIARIGAIDHAVKELFTFRHVNVGSQDCYLLSRLAPAGADYSGRTNHIAHHLVVDREELSGLKISPVDAFLQMSWQDRWEGEPRFFEDSERIDLATFSPKVDLPAKNWKEFAGDERCAALPFELATSGALYFVYDQEFDPRKLLNLFGESLLLLNPKRKDGAEILWQTPFTTFLQTFEKSSGFAWIGCLRESPAAAEARGNQRSVIELGLPLAPAGGSLSELAIHPEGGAAVESDQPLREPADGNGAGKGPQQGSHASSPSPRLLNWVPPLPENLNRLLPQFQITRLIGRGAMAAVYEGMQLSLNRKVAIKLLPAELATNQDFVERFRREAQTLAQLQHPGIVAVFDSGQTADGHPYFVMEFVDGTDLHKIIHGPGLNPEQALEFTIQICEALHYAHQQNVIHRDIKPANILVTRDGRAKLADFGLGRPLTTPDGALTASSLVMGTPDYMAPEQWEGRADQRADIYALGVMLYEMLTGSRPHGAFELPSERARVDARLDKVVVKAMRQEPDQRYQQVSELRQDVERIRTEKLRQAAGPRSQTAFPESRPEGWTRRKRSPSNLMGWIAAAAVGLMLLGIAMFFPRKGSTPESGAPIVPVPAAEPSPPRGGPLVANTAGTSRPDSLKPHAPVGIPTAPLEPPLSVPEPAPRHGPATAPIPAPVPALNLAPAPAREPVPTTAPALTPVREPVPSTTPEPVREPVLATASPPAPAPARQSIPVPVERESSSPAPPPAPAVSALPAVPAAPAPPAMAVPEKTPLIERFSSEAPNLMAWALAPLEEEVPPDIRQSLTFLSEDLVDEGKTEPAASIDAYRAAYYLCGALLSALDQRDQGRVAAGYRAAQAEANTRVTSQALEARRNYMMSWPQYHREQSQRGELYRQSAARVTRDVEAQKVAWTTQVAKTRTRLDGLYRQFRAAMRK